MRGPVSNGKEKNVEECIMVQGVEKKPRTVTTVGQLVGHFSRMLSAKAPRDPTGSSLTSGREEPCVFQSGMAEGEALKRK
jgi:hypothetical protein